MDRKFPISDRLAARLRNQRRRWLVTGAAGFIGSHLVETLLHLDQSVRGLDNFSTGSEQNLADIKSRVSPEQWACFDFVQADIRHMDACRAATANIDVVIHEAALGSVPRSIKDPLTSHLNNVDGFLHMLMACHENKVGRIVYASSSSVYGTHPALPKRESRIGRPLSPYAATKLVNEIYADVFARCFSVETIGLRYFNVFGPRQNPSGPYAAVIPLWISSIIENTPVFINGDGSTSRDFCYVANVVQANLLAATTTNPDAVNEVYNVAVSGSTTLLELFAMLQDELAATCPWAKTLKPTHRPFRAGDVRHSHASIAKARRRLGYKPSHQIKDGLAETVPYFAATHGSLLAQHG